MRNTLIFFLLTAFRLCNGQDHTYQKIMFLHEVPNCESKIAELKISAFIIYELAYDSTGTEQRKKSHVYNFDSKGNLIEYIFFNTAVTEPENVFLGKDVYFYNAHGALIEHKHYDDGNTNETWSNRFEETTSDTTLSGVITTKTSLTQEYASGKFVKIDSTAEGVVIKSLYENNNLVAVYRTESKINAFDTTRYWYDNRGNCIKFKTTNIECEQDIASFERKYNDQNKLILENAITAMGEKEVTKFRHGKAGIVIEREFYDLSNSLQLLTVIEYDANELKKSQVVYDAAQKPLHGEIYEYVFRKQKK